MEVTFKIREGSFLVIEYRGFIQVFFGFIECPRWLWDPDLRGSVEPIETFLSSFYGTTPGVQPLSFAREWREKNRSPHETEISTLSRIFFKIKHQISEKMNLSDNFH